MGFLDKAKELLGQHDDKVDDALNKVGDMAKKKFGHEDQIDQATAFAREHTGEGDTTRGGQPGQAPPPPPGGQAPPPPPGGQAPPPPPPPQ